jgi:hypothetical protein
MAEYRQSSRWNLKLVTYTAMGLEPELNASVEALDPLARRRQAVNGPFRVVASVGRPLRMRAGACVETHREGQESFVLLVPFLRLLLRLLLILSESLSTQAQGLSESLSGRLGMGITSNDSLLSN